MIVQISPELQEKIAEKLVEEMNIAFHDRGKHYLITTAGSAPRVEYVEDARSWNPWIYTDHFISLQNLLRRFTTACEDHADFTWSDSEADDDLFVSYDIALDFLRSYICRLEQYDTDTWDAIKRDERGA
jgi:hypothetical protein